MKNRTVQQLIQSTLVTDGAGVSLQRSIGSPALRNLDPFIMLDHFSSDNPDDYIAGFPEHPHRGFNTFTYMLDGCMRHADSMGNQGDLGPGSAQWMKAGSGIIHSEMPQQLDGLMRGFQLWVNLPAAQKMTAPAYQEIDANMIPQVEQDNSLVRVLAGTYAGQQGPVQDANTQVQYLDVSLAANTQFSHSVSPGNAVFLYVFEGTARVGNTKIPLHHLAVLSDAEHLQVDSDQEAVRFLLVAGRPINEPIVQHGPFVMNTQAEIDQAIMDLRRDQLVIDKATM